MAASNPLHRDASASRQPSSHSLHGITASNAALPSRKLEGLLGPLRPWSGSRSCGRPPKPRPLPFARASQSHGHTLMLSDEDHRMCARAVRVMCAHVMQRGPTGSNASVRLGSSGPGSRLSAVLSALNPFPATEIRRALRPCADRPSIARASSVGCPRDLRALKPPCHTQDARC